jgi:hypothetical protein
MYWLVHAKRHDNDFDVSLFLLAIVRVSRKSTSLTKSKRNTKYISQWELDSLKIIIYGFGHL